MPPGDPPSPGVRNRVVVNTFLLTASTMLARIAMFGLGVVLARSLGAEDFGRYGLGVALAAIVVPLTDLGTSAYIAREVARSRADGEAQIQSLLRARVLFAIAGNLLAAGLVVLLATDGRTEAAVLLALGSAAFDGLAQFGFGYFQGLERMSVQARTTSLTSLARALGGIAIALITESLPAVLVWSLAMGVAQAGVTGALTRREAIAARTLPRVQPAWRTVLAMGAVSILVMVILRADAVLLGALRSEREVGWYAAAWALMAGLQILPWTISVSLGPVFARTHGNDPDAFARAWGAGFRAVVILASPVALIVTLLAGPIVARLYGSAYEEAATPLAIVVWSMPLAAMSSIATSALRGAGREGTLTRIMALGATGNIAVNLWVISRFGVDGAAAVNVGTELLIFGALILAIRQPGLPAIPGLAWIPFVAALLAVAATALALHGQVPVELAVAASAFVYGAIAMLTQLVTPEDLRLLRRSPV